MHTRSNETMARVVEQGVIIDSLKGAANAWVFMAATRVPKPVMLRVLAEPGRRRPGDVAAVAMVSVDAWTDGGKAISPSPVLHSYLQSLGLTPRLS
jgi:hypothetical protein